MFTEAEYAFNKRKEIIPLKLQEKCLLEGWMGMICSPNYYYDFSVPEKFEASWRMLRERLKQAMPDVDHSDAGTLPQSYCGILERC